MGEGGLLEILDNWDQQIILRYNGFGGKPLTVLFRFISFLGRETIWLMLIAFYLLIWYDPHLLSYISSTFLMGVILIAPIKKLVNRARPFETLEKIKVLERTPTSRSFPSWHAYNVVSQGLLFSYLLNSSLVFFISLIIMVLVSFSRIQLGVHYPFDVIFGCLLGFLGFLLSLFMFSPLILIILRFFEGLFTVEIQYQMINTLLTENALYLLFVIGIYVIILIIAFYKKLKEIFKSK